MVRDSPSSLTLTQVRDKQSLIQGQLDRATYTVSPAQQAELESAFAHFDKTGDRKLNKVQFSAAVESMDPDSLAHLPTCLLTDSGRVQRGR